MRFLNIEIVGYMEMRRLGDEEIGRF